MNALRAANTFMQAFFSVSLLVAAFRGELHAQTGAPTLSDLFAEPEASEFRGSTDRKKVANDSSETYRCFGQAQIYAGNDEAWLFLDVDVHTTEAKGYSSFREQEAFHVFIFDKEGRHWKSTARDELLTAHANFMTFFRHDGETFAYNFTRDKFFHWQVSDADERRFVPYDDMKQALGLVLGKLPENLARLLELCQAEGFERVASENYGAGGAPYEAFASSDLGLRIIFERHGSARLGWNRVRLEVTSEHPPRQKILLDLAELPRGFAPA